MPAVRQRVDAKAAGTGATQRLLLSARARCPQPEAAPALRIWEGTRISLKISPWPQAGLDPSIAATAFR
jgi:hypothetical protein